MTGDADSTADAFVTYVTEVSTGAEPFKALRALRSAARALRNRREMTRERWQRLTNQIELVKRMTREGRN